MFEPCRTWAGAWVRLISGIVKRSGYGCERGGGKRGNALRRSRCGERQRAHDNALRELDLEQIVSGGFCVGERRLRRAAEGGSIRIGAREDPFGRTRPPRLGGNAAEREPRIADRALFDPQASGGRYDGEGVGSALSNL